MNDVHARRMLGKDHRVLVVDVRPHRIGFAVIETPVRLLDFGITRAKSPDAGLRRVTALIRRFGPAIVVLRKLDRRSTRSQPLTRSLLRLISRQPGYSSIHVAVVGDRQVKTSLGGDQILTKHQVASLLAREFPELAWKLPQPRKAWQPESWNMLIFDSVALGASYLASQNDKSVIHKLAG
jgi:hypothetical protein